MFVDEHRAAELNVQIIGGRTTAKDLYKRR
jgi:hypothetical protein